eukprot:CAMPEP_0178487940 /NCGR_PEP_ID=MMETSP0696-20121128/9589_1 /TAXON_ID=265572 /ORGANISM="Extubocellulus spinifer, Strain CCMP396" /LENGTH=553 /DNA_ID=CAMNT_0020115665 /DNA_START=54 /DNA_END=1715 /DNA_ORIENTATION=-
MPPAGDEDVTAMNAAPRRPAPQGARIAREDWPESWITDPDTYVFVRAYLRYIVNEERSDKLMHLGLAVEELDRMRRHVPEDTDLLFVIQPDDPSGIGFMCDGGSPDTSWLCRSSNEDFGVDYDLMTVVHKMLVEAMGTPDISPPYTQADKESHALRFRQYQRIKFSTGKEGRDRWKLGTVTRLYYREDDWLPGYCAYQFQDDDGDYRFAPKDTDEFIRNAQGKGGRARRSPSVNKDVWFLFGRNCLHPRDVPWKGGDLGIADQSTFGAAESYISNGEIGLEPHVFRQWKALTESSRFTIVTKFAEMVFRMREDFLKSRITRAQVELLIPELYTSKGKSDLVAGRGDSCMTGMLNLLDGACECGYCVEKACEERGIFRSLREKNIGKLLVECNCPCPRSHKRDGFIIGTDSTGYCIDTGEVVDGCFAEMWGSARRFLIGNFFTNFGFFAQGDFIAREDAGEGLIDSLVRDFGKMNPALGASRGSNGSAAAPARASSAIADVPKCSLCSKKEGGREGITLFRCSRCKLVFYCCKEHQERDWPNHRRSCKKQASAK